MEQTTRFSVWYAILAVLGEAEAAEAFGKLDATVPDVKLASCSALGPVGREGLLICGFNRSTQQIDGIVQRVFRSLVSFSGVRWVAERSR
jgi:hypothetical protein